MDEQGLAWEVRRAVAIAALRVVLACYSEVLTLRRRLDPDGPLTGIVLAEARAELAAIEARRGGADCDDGSALARASSALA